MSETLTVPWNTKAILSKKAIYAVVLCLLVFAASKMGEWNETAWVAVIAALFILYRAWRVQTISQRSGPCLELGPETLRINCWDKPVTLRWDGLHSCELAAVHTLLRSDSLLLLLREDRLPPGLDPDLVKPFPRVPGTRAMHLDCVFIDMDCSTLLAEIDRRIA